MPKSAGEPVPDPRPKPPTHPPLGQQHLLNNPTEPSPTRLRKPGTVPLVPPHTGRCHQGQCTAHTLCRARAPQPPGTPAREPPPACPARSGFNTE